jgi:hypothetical protein
MRTAIIIILGIALLCLVIKELLARYCPKGCEECNEWSSCLHCPLQGTPRCPVVQSRSHP